ncbi:MAG: O-antigen ligase family protein [Armatimonadetes bacterium]|nr:O-antigen ligase family protein [Armatimonadota bacterium]
MKLCLLLWLNFMLYMFLIGGTVKALFMPSTLLVNHIICFAMWIGILLSVRQTRDDVLRLTLAGSLTIWYLLASVFSIYPRLSFEVAMQRLMYFAVFLIAWRTAETEDGTRCIAISLLTACAFEVALSLFQWLVWLPRRPPGEPFERVIIGTLNHPNDLAMFLILGLPMWLATIAQEQKRTECNIQAYAAFKFIGIVGALLTTFCLLLTCSRSGYIGMFAMALSFLALTLKWKSEAKVSLLNIRHMPIIVASFATLMVCVLLVPGNWVLRRLIAMFTHFDISVYNRIAMWKYTALMVEDRWLTGYGAGCYPLAYPKFIPQGGVREIFLHPHNFYLHIAAEAGTVGLLLTGIVALLCITNGYRHIRSIANKTVNAYKVAAWCACIGFLVGSLGNSELEIPAIMCALMALLGICIADKRGSCYESTVKPKAVWQLARLSMALPITVLMVFLMRFDFAHFLFSAAIRGYCSEAIKLLQRSIELDRQNAYYASQLGLMLHRNDTEVAMRMYERSLLCFDGDPLHWHNLGHLNLLKLKRLIGSWSMRLDELSDKAKEEAQQLVDASLKCFSNALSLDPSNDYYRSCVLCVEALQRELNGDTYGAINLLNNAMRHYEWTQRWAREHAVALAKSLGINLTDTKPLHKPQVQSHKPATINELRLHLPVRYRRIGIEREVILVE